MKLRTFRGGIHPPEYKHLTEDVPIRTAALPALVRLPLKQNAGSPSRPLVGVGEPVGTGQKIAEAAGSRSVPLHASISGTVSRIATFPVPYGGEAPCIEIEGDGRDTPAWGGNEAENPFALSGEAILSHIEQAGIVGQGGAEFPTHVKLQPPPDKPIHTLIVNGAECEPFLTVDHRLMCEYPSGIIAGIRLMMRALGVEQACIGIEANKGEAFQKLTDASASEENIHPLLLRVKYPQGAEKQLIKAVTGREVPPGGLPADVGVVVQNVGTALAVYEACVRHKPLFERVITVSGTAVRGPANVRVRIGTLFRDLLEECGGLTPDAAVLISGGPMMGTAQWTTEVPVVKGTTGIIALTARETAPPSAQPCIRCGRCVAACPMGLSPPLIRRAIEKGKWEEAGRYGVIECMECGACAYLCPANRNQVQLYKRAKAALEGKRG